MADYLDLLKGFASVIGSAGIGTWIDPDTNPSTPYPKDSTAVVIASLIESVDKNISLDFTVADENPALPMGSGILSLLVRGAPDDELAPYAALSQLKDLLHSKNFDFGTIRTDQVLLLKTLQIGDDQNNRPQMGMVFQVDYEEQPTDVRF
ncbi:hypothetical protein [Gryllotalpicola koreensis]|uniref:DUF3168 domain-containing protein n=1 Tax=Gryllotalpicola koreensis TaxID=993086 RepID=A0ABP8A1P5_9MICO